MTETVDLAMDPPVAPGLVLSGQADDQASEFGIDGRATWLAGRWLGPAVGDETSVPGDHRCWAHDQQRPTLSSSVHHGGEQSEDRPVRLVELRTFDLALQHEDLMSESQDLGVAWVAAGEELLEPCQDEPSEQSDQCHDEGGYAARFTAEMPETQGVRVVGTLRPAFVAASRRRRNIRREDRIVGDRL